MDDLVGAAALGDLSVDDMTRALEAITDLWVGERLAEDLRKAKG